MATLPTNEASWLAKRKQHITGTDVAKILGVSKFGDALTVYLDKTGQLEREEPTRKMIAGNRYQKAILEDYALETGHKITHSDPYGLLVHSAGVLGASLDALDDTLGHVPVDAKNVGFANEADGWGEAGTDQIPQDYRLQLAAQMAVTGKKLSRLAVLVGGWDLRIYQIDQDPKLEAMILETAAKFWRDHVQAQKVPDLMKVKSSSALDYLASRYPVHMPMHLVESIEDDKAWVDYLKQANRDFDKAEKQIEEAQVWFKQRIGEGEGLLAPDGHIVATWKNSKEGSRVDYKGIVEHLNPPPGVIAQFTKTYPGSRRFLFKEK